MLSHETSCRAGVVEMDVAKQQVADIGELQPGVGQPRLQRLDRRARPAVEERRPVVRIEEVGADRPLVALVVEGPRAIEAFRALAGATDPVKATPGTIRGDYALEVQDNIVHGSDSPDSAKQKIKIFFPNLV